MKRLISIFIVFLQLNMAFAMWQPVVRNFTVNDYEAGTQNWQVMQAPNGWMYVANHQGLLEYDGCTWHLYGLWHSSPLYSFAFGDSGEIYAGGSNEFGKFVPTKTGHMKYASLTEAVPSAYRAFGEIWRVFYDEGIVYLQTRHYIFVYNEDGHVDVIDPAATIYSALVQNHSLYVATSNGLSLYSGKRLHPLSGGKYVAGYEVSAMSPYDEQSFLIATDFAGLFIYDGTSVKPFPTVVDDYLKRNQVYSLAVNDSYLAIGTVQDGIVLTDKNGQNDSYIGRAQGLQNVTALAVSFDKNGNLWAGLDQGLAATLIDSPIRFLHFGNHDLGTGYSFAEHNGISYFATNQGLYATRSVRDMAPVLLEGSSGQVWRLCKANGVFYCCHNRGLFEVQGMRLKQLDIEDGVWNVLPLDEQRAIACTYSGFYLLDTHHSQVICHIKGYDETSLFAALDQWNRMWTRSTQGIVYLTFNDTYTAVETHLALPNDTHTQPLLTKIGNDVIVTGENYLAKVEADGTLAQVDELAAMLAGKRLYPLLCEAPNGNLLYMYDGRLSCLTCRDTATTATQVLQRCCSGVAAVLQREYDSVPTEVMNAPKFFVGGFANLSFDESGAAIVGGVDGFYTLRSREDNVQQAPSRVFVRSIKHDELGLLYGDRCDDFDSLKTARSLSLKSGAYLLHVDFASNIVNREGMMFQTRLLPEETEFSAWTTASSRDIALLSPGRHTLEVRMHIPGSSDATTSLNIYVDYPWYMKWWAILLYALVLMAMIYGVFWYARRRIRRSQKLIEAEKEAEIRQQEIRILQLEQEQAQFALKSKSRELNSVLLNQVNRNEITASLHTDVRRIIDLVQHGETDTARKCLYQLDARLSAGVHQDKDWKRFEDNFDFINDRFIRKLTAQYPWMSKQEKKLCVYIYMGLQTKEIAPLLNLSTRGVEMMRYRLRQKMNLEAQINLKTYFEEMLSQEE